MKRFQGIVVLALFALVATTPATADEFSFRVIASGLAKPTGIVIEGSEVIYFTQVPTPAVPGANSVARFDLEDRELTILHMGEPEPRNLALDREGNLYWTCTSAGVILKQSTEGEEASTTAILTGLNRPIGLAVDRRGTIFYTEVPTPGVAGGANRVVRYDGSTDVLHMGEPEPVDIAVAKDGDLYWTCKSAGVILKQSGGITTALLTGLDHPVGIALDHKDRNLYFTEVPTPGVGGGMGGRNKIWRVDLRTGERKLIHEGDPEPTDITVARNGNIYWTCTSAGVIVEGHRRAGDD